MDEKLKCFIITPVGSGDVELKEEITTIINNIIQPTLISHGFEQKNIFAAHQLNASGSITKQIVESINNSDLIIANLTGLNPNVMYELAIAHAFRKKTIIIVNEDTVLPFDVKIQRVIMYKNNFNGFVKFQTKLNAMVSEILEADTFSIDNPIYDYLEKQIDFNQFIKSKDATPEMVALLRNFENRIDQIDYSINRLIKYNRNMSNKYIHELSNGSSFTYDELIGSNRDEKTAKDKTLYKTILGNSKLGNK